MSTPDTPSNTETTEAQAADAQAADGQTPDAETTEAPETEESSPEALRDRIEALEEELEALEEERDAINNKLLRKAAEFENYRRRTDREQSRQFTAGKVDAVRAMLDVLDDLERSLDAADQLESADDPAAAYESLRGGVQMVHQKFLDELSALGVERIEAEGAAFDESLHEALMQQPTDDAAPGTVLSEARSGYRLGDRVIRYSRVIVATAPDDASDDAPDDTSTDA